MSQYPELFASSLIILFLVHAGVVWSIFVPHKRIWPPGKMRTWQFWSIWPIVGISSVQWIFFAFADWNSFTPLGHWMRFIPAVVISLYAALLKLQSMHALSLKATVGCSGTLINNGPYRWSRNPMYISNILLTIGLSLLCNSTDAYVLSLLWILWFIVAVYAEEAWLFQQHGSSYTDYCKKVPRWINIPFSS